jgi:predicted ArsR family transcriptional regulator
MSLHPNTVRWHLGILADAGLVTSRAEPRGSPGRPRIVYSPAEPRTEARDEYRLLATILAGSLDEAGGGVQAERAGAVWGRYLVARPEPFSRITDEEATAAVAAVLEQQGFQPEVDGADIRMHRCPFHDLAEAHPDVVCGVHRGLISGALAELGCSRLEVGALEIFPQPDVCVAALRHRAP